MNKLISVIVPLYNEEEVLPESYRRLTNVLSGMEENYELIFVNDGSRDKTFAMASDIQKKDPHVVLVDFSRNFGQQMAVSAGLDQARGDAVVIIDADLQDPPELIPQMVHRKEGKLLFVSSVWGNVGASMEVAYSASKGGINSFARALAKELAPSNIQVNAVAFGVIDTQMNRCFSEEECRALKEEIPADRMGTCAEAAEMISQVLHSPAYLTGQVITMDGGWI